MKKVLTALAMLLLMLSIVLTASAALNYSAGNNIYWDYREGTLTLTGTGKTYDFFGTDGSMGSVHWYPFLNEITKVYIGDGITGIGNCAFANMPLLEEVQMPRELQSIGDKAFAGSGLKTIHLPNQIKTIGSYAFAYSEIEQITIPDSVTSIGQGCFYQCASLKNITFGRRVTSIPSNCFRECGLETITLPTTIKVISGDAFYRCPLLRSVNIGNGVTVIDNGAFYNCPVLKEVTLGSNLGKISNSAFYNCPALEELVIPDKVKTIGSNAFSYCNALKSVKLGNSVEVVDSSAFENCKALERVDFGTSLQKIGISAFRYCFALKSIVLPDSLTELGSLAFESCYSLTQAGLGSGLTELESEVFRSCTSLEGIIIPDTIEKIGSRAFSGCTGMTAVKFGSGLKSINSQAFSYCQALKAIRFPEGLTDIGGAAFSECTALTSVTLPLSLNRVQESCFNLCGALKDVHYKGSDQERAGITIEDRNEPLLNAQWHYQSDPSDAMAAIMGKWIMSADGKSCFIYRPEIIGGSGNVTIAYNIYDADGNAINYFYSDDPVVAATCPYNGTFNVFVVVSDRVTSEQTMVMTGWFKVTGYDDGLKVSEPVWRLSADGRSCFIDRPTISGANGSYTIAYNIYDSMGNAINYFYSLDAAVAATCPYNGMFNVYVVVTDERESQIVMTGWFEIGGYKQSAITFDDVEDFAYGLEEDTDSLQEDPDEGMPETIVLPQETEEDTVPVMAYEVA